MCLSAICMSSCDVSVVVVCHFLNWIVFFFLYICSSSLYSGFESFGGEIFISIWCFFPVWVFRFHYLNGVIWRTEALSGNEIQIINHFLSIAFCVQFQKSFPSPRSWKYSPMFYLRSFLVLSSTCRTVYSIWNNLQYGVWWGVVKIHLFHGYSIVTAQWLRNPSFHH